MQAARQVDCPSTCLQLHSQLSLPMLYIPHSSLDATPPLLLTPLSGLFTGLAGGSQLTLPLLSTCLAVAAVLMPAVSLRVVLWRLGLLPGGPVLAGCRARLVVHLRGHLRLPRRRWLVRAAAGLCLMAAGG